MCLTNYWRHNISKQKHSVKWWKICVIYKMIHAHTAPLALIVYWGLLAYGSQGWWTKNIYLKWLCVQLIMVDWVAQNPLFYRWICSDILQNTPWSLSKVLILGFNSRWHLLIQHQCCLLPQALGPFGANLWHFLFIPVTFLLMPDCRSVVLVLIRLCN